MEHLVINAGTFFKHTYAYAGNDLAAYKIILMSLNNRYVIQASYSDNTITSTATSNETSKFDSGNYKVSIVESIDNEKTIIATGRAIVNSNIDSIPDNDVLSHNEKMLASIRKRLEGRILSDHENYSVDGRALSRISIDTLHDLEKKYAWRVRHEQVARGERTRHKRIRFR